MYEQYYNQQSQYNDDEVNPSSFSAMGQEHQIKIAINKLVLATSGEYGQQYLRPWVTNYTQDNRNAVAEAIGRTQHQHNQRIEAGQIQADAKFNITPELFTGASTGFIQPSSNFEARAHANLKHGWGTQTCRFMMSVTVKEPQALEPSEFIVIGYTDYMGVTQQGNVADDMQFTVNTIFRVANTPTWTPSGTVMVKSLRQVNQVLSNVNYINPEPNRGTMHRMRPEDVIAGVQISHIQGLKERNLEVTDMRQQVITQPALSSVNHANPNHYMASIVGGLVAGEMLATTTNRRSEKYDLAITASEDNKIIRNSFFTALKNFNHGSLENKFTFRDLRRMDPNVDRDEVTFVQWRDRPTKVGASMPGMDMHVAGTTSDWADNTINAQHSARICNMLPSLMAGLAIMRVGIYASNKSGTAEIRITYAESVTGGIDLTPQMESLRIQVQSQIINELSNFGQSRYEVLIAADVTGEIWVDLDLEGADMTRYVSAGFASSATSPVLTRNFSQVTQLSTAFNTLQTEVFPQSHNVLPNNNYWGMAGNPPVGPTGPQPIQTAPIFGGNQGQFHNPYE